MKLPGTKSVPFTGWLDDSWLSDNVVRLRESLATHLAAQFDEALCKAISDRIGEPVSVPTNNDKEAFLARFRDRLSCIKHQDSEHEEWHLDGKPLMYIFPIVWNWQGPHVSAYRHFMRVDPDGNPL